MSQFIRPNIDIISSKTSRPQTSESNDSNFTLTSSNDAEGNSNTLQTLNKPILNNGLSSQLFQNYTMMTSSAKTVQLNSNQNFPPPPPPTTTASELLSERYQSANEGFPTSNKSVLINKFPTHSEYELQTHEGDDDDIDRNSFYSSVATQSPNDQIPRVRSKSEKLYDWLTRFYDKLNLRSGIDESHNDLERQPLIPIEDGNQQTSDNTTLYYVISVIVGIIITLIMIFSGDNELLSKILKALVCYLIGAKYSKAIFGDDFCPSFD